MGSCFVSFDSTEEGAEVASKPMSAWNPFFALGGGGFFGVDGDSGLPIIFYEYLPGRDSSGGFGLAVPWAVRPGALTD